MQIVQQKTKSDVVGFAESSSYLGKNEQMNPKCTACIV